MKPAHKPRARHASASSGVRRAAFAREKKALHQPKGIFARYDAATRSVTVLLGGSDEDADSPFNSLDPARLGSSSTTGEVEAAQGPHRLDCSIA